MTSEQDLRTKGRAVFLAAIMVLSMVAMSATIIGAAAAANVDEDTVIDQEPVFYTDDSDVHFIEVVFEDEDDDIAGSFDEDNVTVYDRTGDNESVEATDVEFEHDSDANVTGVKITLNEPLYLRGTVEIDDWSSAVTITTATIEEGANDIDAFVGEDAAIYNEDEHGSWVTITDPDRSVDRGLGDASEVRLYDRSSMFEDGDNVSVDFHPNGNVDMDLNDFGDMNLDAEGGEETISASVSDADTILYQDWEEDDGDPRELEFRVLDDEGVEVASADTTYDAEGDASVSFTDVDAGEYTVVVSDIRTGISEEVDVEVEAVPEEVAAEWELADTVHEEELGDVADIGFELVEGDEPAEFNVSMFDDAGNYELQLTIMPTEDGVDEGEFELGFNSWLAGNTTNEADLIEYDDELVSSVDIEDQTSISPEFRLVEDQLEIVIWENEFDDSDETDMGVLNLVDRSTDDLTVYTAPGAGVESIDDVDELADIEDNITATDSIAEGDWVMVEIDVSGIYGYGVNETAGEFNDPDEFYPAATGISFEIEQTNPATYQSAWDGDETEFESMFVEADDNSVYLVIDSDDLITESGADLAAGTGNEFDLTFTISEANPYVDEDEEVNASISLSERSWSFDEIDEIVQDDEVTITGTSNVAPDTEVSNSNFRIQSTVAEHSFIRNAADNIVVEEDGTWTATVENLADETPQNVSVRLSPPDHKRIEMTVPMVEDEPEPEEAAFEFSNLEYPENVEPGDDIEITVDLTNVGDAAGETDVDLEIGDVELSDFVELDANETETVSFIFNADDLGEGEHDFTITESATDDSVSGTITVEEDVEPAAFEITDVDAPATADEGDTVTFSGTVENVGGETGTTQVEFHIATITEIEEDVELEPGESETFEWEITLDIAPGDYDFVVLETFSEDEMTGSITVEAVDTPTPTPPDTPTPTPPDEPTPTPTPEPDDQPGFGLIVGILAMLGAALLAYRRYQG